MSNNFLYSFLEGGLSGSVLFGIAIHRFNAIASGQDFHLNIMPEIYNFHDDPPDLVLASKCGFVLSGFVLGGLVGLATELMLVTLNYLTDFDNNESRDNLQNNIKSDLIYSSSIGMMVGLVTSLKNLAEFKVENPVAMPDNAMFFTELLIYKTNYDFGGLAAKFSINFATLMASSIASAMLSNIIMDSVEYSVVSHQSDHNFNITQDFNVSIAGSINNEF